MQSHKEDNKRLAKNTIALYFRSFVVMFVGLYISRTLLKELGAEDYGLYNVVGGIVVLFSFLNGALSLSVQRFINFELGKDNLIGAKRVFSASMGVQLILMLTLFVIIESFGVWFLNNKLNIPPDRINAANWAFQFSIITFCAGIIRVPYEATVIAYEKMTFFAYMAIIDVILKLSIVVAISFVDGDKLIYYALLMAIEVVVTIFIYRFYCKKNFCICDFRIERDRSLYKQILSFSGWSLTGNATYVATHQGFVFLINMYYDLTVNAALGIANQVIAAVSQFASSFATSYRPQIVKAYAKNEQDHLYSLINTTSKMSFSLIVFPCFLLIFNMPFVLNIWLDEVPQYTIGFCQVLLVCSIVDAMTTPYNAAIMSTTKIRNYQLFISLSYILDLIVSFVLILNGVLPYVVLISRIFTRGILNMIIGLFYLNKLLEFPVKSYIYKCLCPILIVLIVNVPILFSLYIYFDGFKMFLLSSFSILTILPLSLYYILLSSSERQLINNFIYSKFSRNKSL